MRKPRRELNLEATRAALLEEARRQFAAVGFNGAELNRIAEAAGVTTGAIYHHYGSKAGLFQAVAEQIEGEILAGAGGAGASDPLQALRNGFNNLISVCAAPDIQRIIFVEAPQVLGPEAWFAIELRYAFGATQRALAGLAEAKTIPPFPSELLARVLLALLREVSGAIAREPGNAAIEAAARRLANAVLDGLLGIGSAKTS